MNIKTKNIEKGGLINVCIDWFILFNFLLSAETVGNPGSFPLWQFKSHPKHIAVFL